MLTIIFDKINHKDYSENRLIKKRIVDKTRKNLIEQEFEGITRRRVIKEWNNLTSTTGDNEPNKEVFGIGINSVLNTSDEVLSSNLPDHDTTLIEYDNAMKILNKAINIMMTFKDLTKLSKTSSINFRQFPFMRTAINLFFNEEFSNDDKDVIEHDRKIDNILSSWTMTRERVARDGDCFFRSIARNLCRMRDYGELTEEAISHFKEIEILSMCEEELTAKLRMLTVKEWQGNRRVHYEHFLTKDHYDTEVEKFKVSGYFTGELGNLMVLAMSNLLKLPVVVFSSLENYPVIPVLPESQLKGNRPLYVSFNSLGCGHYDFVKPEDEDIVQEVIMKSQEKEEVNITCSCGVNKKGDGLKNICNNSPGTYGSRCKCLRARIQCSESCRCKGCCNPYGQRAKSVTSICAPRKRQKFSYQMTSSRKSDEFLVMRGEKPRESSMTDAEYFVLEEIILHQRQTEKDVDNPQ